MADTHADMTRSPHPAALIGPWRRFGAIGPVYEIIAMGASCPDGGRLMRVRVAETGEEVDYPLTGILGDPRES